MTVKELLNLAIAKLMEAGIENPRFEAEILLANLLKKDRIFLVANSEETLPKDKADLFLKLAERREKKEPLAYIFGRREFYGRNFFVTPSVLIPRPETELIIDSLKSEKDMKIDARILDLCAGSGCIGLTLAKELEKARITLSDVSSKAVEIIKRNAENLGVIDRVEILESDLFQNIRGRFDALVCNPPYIPSKAAENLDETVRLFEPRLALDGGADGLEFYKKIIPAARGFLSDKGIIVFEIGFDQGESVTKILKENGFASIKIRKDLAGLDRVVEGGF